MEKELGSTEGRWFAGQSALSDLPSGKWVFTSALAIRLMLVPIAKRVAPSTSNQNGSKCLVAIAEASGLLSIVGCASDVETGVGI